MKNIERKYLVVGGILLGLVVLVVIVLVVIMLIVGKKLSPEQIQEKLVEAAQDYIKDGNVEKPTEGNSIIITDKELVAKEYIKDLVEYNEDENCTGSVTLINNNSLGLYIPSLECKEYKTVTLKDKIIEDQLVEEEIVDGTYQFGLYKVDDEYIFKGKTVNNYVTFGGVSWRILKIDSDGNLRLLKRETEDSIVWDNKYNDEVGKRYGINDYANSYLYETLKTDYAGFKEKNKKHLIAQDVCIGKRSSLDLEKNDEFECSTILENQYISTLSSIDVAMASLDPDCVNVNSRNCLNYNYLSGVSGWTVNAYGDSTYHALEITSGIIKTEQTNRKNEYRWVIHISGNELYHSGNGTVEDPYIIQ